MKWEKLAIRPSVLHQIVIGLYLCLYLILGIYTELRLIETKPLPEYLLEDFGYYERALADALNNIDPYSIRAIGVGYLYPPPTLLIVEVFFSIKPFLLKALIFTVFNVALMIIIVTWIARYYDFSGGDVWYWYVICLGFAPFLELLHIGQINVITLFGISMLFLWTNTSPIMSGMGLGLATITKVSPILFLGYLVANKKFNVLLAAIIAIVLLIGAGIIRYGLSPTLEYPDLFQWLLNQYPLGSNSQSFIAKIPIGNILVVQRTLTLYILFLVALSSILTFYGKQPREALFIVTALGMMVSSNVMWYHHYIFMLLPMLIWIGWMRHDKRIVIWCLLGLLIAQVDRYILTYGLLIHLFCHLSILLVLSWQVKQFYLHIETGRLQKGMHTL